MSGEKWTKFEEDKAKKFLFSGYTYYEISNIIKRSIYSIAHKNARMGM